QHSSRSFGSLVHETTHMRTAFEMGVRRWRQLPAFLLLGLVFQQCSAAPQHMGYSQESREVPGRYFGGDESREFMLGSPSAVHSHFVSPTHAPNVRHGSYNTEAALRAGMRSAGFNHYAASGGNQHYRVVPSSREDDDHSNENYAFRSGTQSSFTMQQAGYPHFRMSAGSHEDASFEDMDDFVDKREIDWDDLDDDDNVILGMGRRYHPSGRAIATPNLFVPNPSTGPPAHPTAINNPYMYKPKYTSDEDDSDEVSFYYNGPLATMRNMDTSDERLVLDEDSFGDRYNFIDNQGSTRWGYTLEDQFQEQIVNTDGSMQGKYGWTAPDGREVRISYIADEGGYRVLSSQGIYNRDDNDEVTFALNPHGNTGPLAVDPRGQQPGVHMPGMGPGSVGSPLNAG
ncbi:unnamed protein product, partial [Meganyctiphanes norvegica]